MRAKDLVIPDEEELEAIEAHDSMGCVLCQLGPKPLSVTMEEE